MIKEEEPSNTISSSITSNTVSNEEKQSNTNTNNNTNTTSILSSEENEKIQLNSTDELQYATELKFNTLMALRQAPALTQSAIYKNCCKKIFIQHNKEDKTRKVENTSVVSYIKQEYLVEKDENGMPSYLDLIDMKYKNLSKTEIAKANIKDALYRDCLIELHDEAVCYFIFDGKANTDIARIVEEKGNAIRKKRSSNDSSLKNSEEGLPTFTEYYIIKFFVKLVNNKLTFNPNSLDKVKESIEKSIHETRYYMKKPNYNEVESYCNKGINIVKNMSNNLKTKILKEISQVELNKLIWPLLSNKSLCYSKKAAVAKCDKNSTDNDIAKHYGDCVKTNQEFLTDIKNYYNTVKGSSVNNSDSGNLLTDNFYIKISLRNADCLYCLKRFDDAEKALSEISTSELLKENSILGDEYNRIKSNIDARKKSLYNNTNLIKPRLNISSENSNQNDTTSLGFNLFNRKNKNRGIYTDDNEESDNKIEWAECSDTLNLGKSINPSVLYYLENSSTMQS